MGREHVLQAEAELKQAIILLSSSLLFLGVLAALGRLLRFRAVQPRGRKETWIVPWYETWAVIE
jgi:hypothetical protein